MTSFSGINVAKKFVAKKLYYPFMEKKNEKKFVFFDYHAFNSSVFDTKWAGITEILTPVKKFFGHYSSNSLYFQKNIKKYIGRSAS